MIFKKVFFFRRCSIVGFFVNRLWEKNCSVVGNSSYQSEMINDSNLSFHFTFSLIPDKEKRKKKQTKHFILEKFDNHFVIDNINEVHSFVPPLMSEMIGLQK